MILGKITGKLSTNSFKFSVTGDAKKFEYLQIMHKEGYYVLAQILEIERELQETIAICATIGFRDDKGILKGLKSPFEPGTEVLIAEDDFIKTTLGLDKKKDSAYLGTLDGRENLKVYIDLNKMITKHVFLTGKTGCQPAGSKVLMTDGQFKNIEEVKEGDYVLSPQKDGTNLFSKVLYTTKWYSKKNYEIFQLNRQHRKLYSCSYNHIIPHYHLSKPRDKINREKRHLVWELKKRTAELFSKYCASIRNHENIAFSSFPIIQFENRKNCEIEPYTLGAYLGDGHFSYKHYTQINKKYHLMKAWDKLAVHKKIHFSMGITSMDPEIIEEISKSYKIVRSYSQKNNKSRIYHFNFTSPLAKQIQKYNLMNKKSGDKFIPKEALYSDIEYRKRLLAGLIDTDGTLSKSSSYSITTKSKQLAEDTLFLVYTLGGRGGIFKIKKGIKKIGFIGEYYRVSFYLKDLELPIKLKRKKIGNKKHCYLAANRIAIDLKKGKPETVYGFAIDSPSKWYITDNFMVTHNSGKTYALSTVLEELLENKIPMLIIDPHGEYGTLRQPNPEDKEKLEKFGLKSKGYAKMIQEFSPDIENNQEAKPLKLSSTNMTSTELIHLLPAKLSNAQLGVLYSALKNLGENAGFSELLAEMHVLEDSSAKWTLVNILEYVKNLNLFSDNFTMMGELVQAGKASIINLRGVPPEVQEVIVYKLLTDLFMERKKGNIPPFFLIIEEAQNFCPERSYGEAKSSPIIRQIAAEGRKFGLGLGIITQRPARLEKSVISQAGTQIIMKLTNPNDTKAVANSIEGITAETEKEIKNIPIGTAMVTGIVDLPLFVNIKPRRSKHGGEAVKIFFTDEDKEDKNFNEQLEEFKEKGDLLPLIPQKVTIKDLRLMSDKPIKVRTILVPCMMILCSQDNKEFNLLIEQVNGSIITNTETGEGLDLMKTNMPDLSTQQTKVLQIALKMKEFKPSEMFAKSGMQFSELYDIVGILAKKGYLTKDNDKYKINETLNKLSNLHEKACYEKVDYKRAEYDLKIEKKIEFDKIKELLSKFVSIKNAKECYLMLYEVNT